MAYDDHACFSKQHDNIVLEVSMDLKFPSNDQYILYKNWYDSVNIWTMNEQWKKNYFYTIQIQSWLLHSK